MGSKKRPWKKRVKIKIYYKIFFLKLKSTWMILDEFTNLVLNLTESDFPVRDIPIHFNLSMKLQINEIDSDRHYSMLFPEFIEAFCRVIDKSSPIPPGEDPV